MDYRPRQTVACNVGTLRNQIWQIGVVVEIDRSRLNFGLPYFVQVIGNRFCWCDERFLRPFDGG